MVDDTAHYVVRLSPRHSLARNGLLSFVFVTLPIFGALALLNESVAGIAFAIVGQVLCLLLGCILYFLYRRTFIGVTATTIEERGFWGARTSTPRAAIDSVVLANTYSRFSNDTVQQLVVRDPSGARLLRMRGLFWTPKAIGEVAAAIDLPLTTPPEDMGVREFFDTYPGTAYWFENSTGVVALAVVVVLLALTALTLGVMMFIRG